MKWSVLLFVLATIASTGVAHAGAMRCGVALVKDDTPLSAVLGTCGAPTQSEHRIEHVTYARADKNGSVSSTTVEVVVDELTYDFGPTVFVYYLRFENGYMVSMRRGERGTAR